MQSISVQYMSWLSTSLFQNIEDIIALKHMLMQNIKYGFDFRMLPDLALLAVIVKTVKVFFCDILRS